MTERRDAPPDDPWHDPVIEEIREIRRKLWEESGRDVSEYVRRAREATERAKKERNGSEAA